MCIPDIFKGKKDFFPFELRYIAPFEKYSNQLKRLQGTAAEAAGRRDEFRGYIIIDLSNYLSHEKEIYLYKALHFFADMGNYWKYIFLIENENVKAARELAGQVLKVLLRDIPCEVKEDAVMPSSKDLLN